MSAIGRIDHGPHESATDGACAMEWRYALCKCSACTVAKAKGIWTDMPPCAPASMRVVQGINDRLADDDRQRLEARIRLIPSVADDADPAVLERVERRAALWAARSVEHLSDDPRVKACNDVTERWLAGEASDAERALAAEAALAARAAGAAGAALAARAAGAARAAEAALAAGAAGADAALDWLDRYLDAWAKIAADEGLMGSCGWLDPADFVQAAGS